MGETRTYVFILKLYCKINDNLFIKEQCIVLCELQKSNCKYDSSF